jgi:bifunctional ADP-heptose synthase (sugar kinase/adenylyltransferase)
MSLIKVDLAKVQTQKDAARIAELKQLLTETDYLVLPDYDKDKPDVLAQRQVWREEIRALEAK